VISQSTLYPYILLQTLRTCMCCLIDWKCSTRLLSDLNSQNPSEVLLSHNESELLFSDINNQSVRTLYLCGWDAKNWSSSARLWQKSLHESWLKKLPEWTRMSPAGIAKDSLLDLVSEMWTTRSIRAFGFSTQPTRHGSDSVALLTITRLTFTDTSFLVDDIFLSEPTNDRQTASKLTFTIMFTVFNDKVPHTGFGLVLPGVENLFLSFIFRPHGRTISRTVGYFPSIG